MLLLFCFSHTGMNLWRTTCSSGRVPSSALNFLACICLPIGTRFLLDNCRDVIILTAHSSFSHIEQSSFRQYSQRFIIPMDRAPISVTINMFPLSHKLIVFICYFICALISPVSSVPNPSKSAPSMDFFPQLLAQKFWPRHKRAAKTKKHRVGFILWSLVREPRREGPA